jgi:UDP-N-acetylglucosamine--N-acetylmuramyl-(pentapeptide) pyrophosphoryl-undecaprenol N-acetylglucosamine transferase
MKKNQHTKTFFLTGGGTGGHIYPCVSILNELKKQGYSSIFYVGNKKNPEFEIITNMGENFLDVPVFGMPRKLSLKFLKWMILLFISIFKCLYYALKFKPDAVFAAGGYVSAPMVIVSNILKIPYIMHDSDAHPGIVTRAFSKNADTLNLAFKEGEKFIKAKRITHFKNPVRDEFFTVSKNEARQNFGLDNELCVLIMGGSQGAKSINSAAIGAIKYFKDNKNVKIIFQTGKKNYEGVIASLQEQDCAVETLENAVIRPYFDKMYLPILAADIIISRAGSLSISEILAAKKPSILIPYPYAAADHQRKNAREIEKTGAALYIEDSDLTPEILIKTIEELILNDKKLKDMIKSASSQITENPTGKILDLILDAAGALEADNN